MSSTSIYNDIANRTGGDIYIGVVGPVRSGKSTFIKRFMDKLVIPNIPDAFRRERANDELPQSSGGKTIMTTEPKFIPEEAVEVKLDSNAAFKVRLIDCVGYIVPSSIGYIEEDNPRMVMTPWYSEPVPFNMAAEMGTKKVITEHSTIGLVVTTDGSISDIDRYEYEEAEERVINELKDINKPFVILLNCVSPMSDSAQRIAEQMREKYGVTVIPVNCLELDESMIKDIISAILFEFPLKEVKFSLPKWINGLNDENELKRNIFSAILNCSENVSKVKECKLLTEGILQCENIVDTQLRSVDLGQGSATVSIEVDDGLFYKILSDESGMKIEDDRGLLDLIKELSDTNRKYMRVKDALDQVESTGYGIVMPTIEELQLEEPEIMKQGGRYGVRLRATAPSIHLMKADIATEVNPIVGSEKQSEELVMSLMSDFEDDPLKIWDSNIFGKSLNELVNEGMHAKLSRLPDEARMRLAQTLERLINEGCSGLICIIL